VLLDADPTLNIGNVQHINVVMKGGTIIEGTRLDLPINTH